MLPTSQLIIKYAFGRGTVATREVMARDPVTIPSSRELQDELGFGRLRVAIAAPAGVKLGGIKLEVSYRSCPQLACSLWVV